MLSLPSFFCLFLVLLRRDAKCWFLYAYTFLFVENKIYTTIDDGYVLGALKISTLDGYPWISVLLAANEYNYDTCCLVALFNDCQIVRMLTPTLYILSKPHGVVFESHVCPR